MKSLRFARQGINWGGVFGGMDVNQEGGARRDGFRKDLISLIKKDNADNRITVKEGFTMRGNIRL
jgi:hypothetical protein